MDFLYELCKEIPGDDYEMCTDVYKWPTRLKPIVDKVVFFCNHASHMLKSQRVEFSNFHGQFVQMVEFPPLICMNMGWLRLGGSFKLSVCFAEL